MATGAGALSMATDERSGDVLVVDRTDADVTRADPEKGVVEDAFASGANPATPRSPTASLTWSAPPAPERPRTP
ncbi:hypothetical protein ACGF7W_27235 [Streptomyces sp. NPDC048219]|uniref:hypothetical protein n=1 Tax=Streptomyces sp. NPDC048219 TaxID=3365517 RepID=UPI0037123DD7